MSRPGVLALALSAVLLTGCFTGERPHFNDDPFPTGAMTGDAAIDAVLLKLDTPVTGPVTATYSVLTKFGNITNTAAAVVDAGNRSVTIGNVRYIQTPTAGATCTVDGSVPCTAALDASRVSDIGVTIDFYSAEAATRLRRDARAKIAPTTPHAETIADQSAICVDVPLAGGTAVYCALDNGLVAKVDDGDVAVNLTALAATADAVLFQIPV
jgi:hypothetical protein